MVNLKEKLMSRKLSIGSWITIGNPSIAEIMAQAGFDWLTIDMEHSAITLSQAQHLIQIIELCGVIPLVRVGENNAYLIKRVMDAGAHGVIVPMVNSRDDAIKAVKAVKYPPVGTRGVGLARAQGYGFNFDDYFAKINKQSIVIVQVEHIDSVNNLELILSVKGIDGCIVGPYDLSASLGNPGNFSHPDVLAALEKVERICKKMKFPLGIHIIPPDYEQVVEKTGKGYTFVAFSLDSLFLGTICREQLKALKERL